MPFRRPRVLSFGCAKGFEPLDLKRIISGATVLGCDVSKSAIVEARRRCQTEGIPIFISSPETLAENGPYHAIVAMNVLTRYPEIQNKENISEIYPFEQFQSAVSAITGSIVLGGFFVLYNSPYCFEQTDAARQFKAVPPQEPFGNGWIEKYDRFGDRITSALAEFEGQHYTIPEWRAALNRAAHRLNDWTIFERLPYQHSMLRTQLSKPDLKTVIWQRSTL